MTKLKYLYPVVFILFFSLCNTNLAQTSNKKPSLKEKLEKVFAIAKQKQTSKKGQNVKNKKLITESKPKDSSQQNKNSKAKKTLLKSRKVKSSLMDALREAMKN